MAQRPSTLVLMMINSCVGYLKIIEDKSSKAESQNSRRRTNHSHQSSTKARGSKPASQPALQHQGARVETRVSASTAAPRREGRNPRLSSTAAPRRVGRNPRLSYNFPRYGVNHCPHNGEINPHYGVFLGGTFTPETSINSPCLLYTSPSPRDRQKSRMPSSA